MSLYKQKGSEVWHVDIKHGGARVRRTTGETDRAKAQQRHNAIQVELWTTVPIVDGHTWGEACDAWLDAETRSDSEMLSLAKFTIHFDDRALRDVTAEELEKALAFCSTAGTYMRYRTMLTAILNKAKKAKWIDSVPYMATKRDKKKKTRDWLTPEQWSALYAELPAHMKPMALFAVETGLRQANVLGLTWDRVDLARRLVWVEAEDTKGNVALSIPLSQGAIDVLTAQRAAIKVGPDEPEPKFVFTFRGKPIGEVKTSFQAACIRAGVGKTEIRGSGVDRGDTKGVRHRYVGFTWHGLRHTWATWHVQNGTPLDVLQKLGGWSDLRMVMNYAHHAPGFVASFANNNRRKT